MKEIALAGIISGLLYTILTIVKVRKHKQVIRNQFSFIEKINLNWILHLSVGVLSIWVIGSIAGILTRFFSFDLPLNWLFVFVPVFIFYIGFYGIRQQIIYPVANYKKNEKPVFEKNKEVILTGRYQKSRLDKQRMRAIYDSLQHAMKSNQLFLDARLNLKKLSDELKIPPHHITQTLNEYAKQTFHDFVNHYRVERVKKQIINAKNKDFSLLGIAFDCGFNSKSSFNRIFKKFTHQTPSEFKNNYTGK